jgi:predicted helicase
LTSPGLEPTNRRRQRHDPQHLDGDVLDGHRRVDNITDPFHQLMKDRYGSEVTKYDDFFFVYALLQSPEYRERYAGELKQMLPASRTFPQRRTTH